MSAELTGLYRSQRLRLANTVRAAAASVWARGYRDREATITEVLRIVTGGQAQIVALVDAYMAEMSRRAVGSGQVRGLDTGLYTVAALRGVDPRVVYGRPFGALGGQLLQGAKPAQAQTSAVQMLGKLVQTDMQLAQTHAARDWMAEDRRVTGYRRALGGSGNCKLCVDASTRVYGRENLMPIHEGCRCSVEPVYAEVAPAPVSAVVRVDDDPELGPRLMDVGWSETGPRL